MNPISPNRNVYQPSQRRHRKKHNKFCQARYRLWKGIADHQGSDYKIRLQLRGDDDDDDGDNQNENGMLSYYYATCLPGMQDILCKELMELGDGVYISSEGGISNKGVAFEATREGALRALIWVRTCHSIMERVCTVEYGIETRQDLYYFIQDNVDWEDLLLVKTSNNNNSKIGTLMVQAVLNNHGATGPDSDLTHSHYTALTVKNALVDMVRNDRNNERPDVDTENPDVPLNIVLDRNGGATLYRLLHHPSSLHKRGYRTASDTKVHAAAMKESMAAGLLYMTGWDALIADTRSNQNEKACLIDPMTGSATLCIEAALMAANIAPALMRIRDKKYHQIPPIVRWQEPRSNNENNMLFMWKKLLLEARQAMDLSFLSNQCIIMANEMNTGAAQLAKQGIQSAGFTSQQISINVGNCRDWDEVNENAFPPGRTIIVANPPWGVRLSEDEEQSWIDLSEFLKNKCRGTEAWILSGGDKATTRLLRMKRTRMIPLQTGNLSLRWIQYHIFDKPPPPPSIEENRQNIPDFKEVQKKSKARVQKKGRDGEYYSRKSIPTDMSWD